MIVIAAATGEFGRLVVDQLLNRVAGVGCRGGRARCAQGRGSGDRGVQVRYGDYDEPDSLRDSFNGTDQLLFISALQL